MMTALHSTTIELVPLADAVAEVRHVPVEEYERYDVLVRLGESDLTMLRAVALERRTPAS